MKKPNINKMKKKDEEKDEEKQKQKENDKKIININSWRKR